MPSLKERMMSEYGLSALEAKTLIGGYMVNHKDSPAKEKSWDTIKNRMDQVIAALYGNITAIDARTDVHHEIFACGKDRQRDIIYALCSRQAETADSFRINNFYFNVQTWTWGLVHAASHKLERDEWSSIEDYRKWNKQFHISPNPARIAEVLGLETKVVGMIAKDGTKRDFQDYMTEKTPYRDEDGKITGWHITKLPNQLTNEIFASLQKSAKEGTYEFFSRHETMRGFWDVLNRKSLSQEDKQMITSAMAQEIGKGYAMQRADRAIILFRNINALDCPEEQKKSLKELAARAVGNNWPVRGQEGFWNAVYALGSIPPSVSKDAETLESYLSKPWQERYEFKQSIEREAYSQRMAEISASTEKIVNGIYDRIVSAMNDKTANTEMIQDIIADECAKSKLEDLHIEYKDGILSATCRAYNVDADMTRREIHAEKIGKVLAAANPDRKMIALELNEQEKRIASSAEKSGFMKEAFLGRDEHAVQMLVDAIRNDKNYNADYYTDMPKEVPEMIADALIASTKDAVLQDKYPHVEEVDARDMISGCVTTLENMERYGTFKTLTNQDLKDIFSLGVTAEHSAYKNTIRENLVTISRIFDKINRTNFTQEEKDYLKQTIIQDNRAEGSQGKRFSNRETLEYIEKHAEDAVRPGAYKELKAYLDNGYNIYATIGTETHNELTYRYMRIDPQVLISAAIEKYAHDYPDLPQPTRAEYSNFGYPQKDGWVNTHNCIFKFKDTDNEARLEYYNGSLRTGYAGHENRTVCNEAMRHCYMSAVTELCFTENKEIIGQYRDAMALADKVGMNPTCREAYGTSKISDVFVAFNNEGHMELSLCSGCDAKTKVCVDMDTGEIWAEKDGEIMSEFDRTMKYPDLDRIFNATMDVLGHEEDRGNELENELGMEKQEQDHEDHEEDADIAD